MYAVRNTERFDWWYVFYSFEIDIRFRGLFVCFS